MGARGRAEVYLGPFEAAKDDEQQSHAAQPARFVDGCVHLGRAEFGLGHLDVAIGEDRKATDAGYNIYGTSRNLAAA
jgi:hypothetical protein